MVLGSTNMGGANMFVLNLLRNMDLNRFQVDFVVNFPERNGGIGHELKDMGCCIYMLPYFKVYNYFFYIKAWKVFLLTISMILYMVILRTRPLYI